MQTRNHDWLNTKTGQPVFGVQAKCKDGKWRNVARDGKPALFDTEQERDQFRAELRQR